MKKKKETNQTNKEHLERGSRTEKNAYQNKRQKKTKQKKMQKAIDRSYLGAESDPTTASSICGKALLFSSIFSPSRPTPFPSFQKGKKPCLEKGLASLHWK
eukprot:TRINITY_DN5650_c2_g1_i1.p2 TRINITY_DN5650_c2_g1~~TRINITY_DN5650_c2_g1_i1.p2  ORF type:complete len:101 (+),score=0.75 TRINITY_DN5650_c2_g1_i1:295-597(+)